MATRSFDPSRAVEIFIVGQNYENYGSGYRIGGGLVLTVSHIFEGGPSISCRVRSRGVRDQPDWETDNAQVVWRASNADAALVKLPENIVDVEPVVFGRFPIEVSSARFRYQMFGWPEWAQTIAQGGRRLAGGRQLPGEIFLADRSPEGYLVLEPDRLPGMPRPGEQGSKWAGLSGAAVICDGLVVAIQSRHQRPDRPASLEAEPVDRFLSDDRFISHLSEHGISRRPELVRTPVTTYLAHVHDKSVTFSSVPWIKYPPETSDVLRTLFVPPKARLTFPTDQEFCDPNKPAEIGISDILQGYTHIVLLGPPGIGKTTLLYYLAEYAPNEPEEIGLDNPYLPIVVPMRKLAAITGSLEDRLNKVLSDELSLTENLPDGFFRDWPIATGKKWLILLDGLNEVFSDDREDFENWLRPYLKEWKNIRVVITSRSSSFLKGMIDEPDFAFFELQPFSAEQVDHFVKQWFELESDMRSFQMELDRARVVNINTPLLLMIAREIYLSSSQDLAENAQNHCEMPHLPDRRASLYQEFVVLLFERTSMKERKRELGDRVSNVAEFALERLATELVGSSGEVSTDRVYGATAAYLHESLNLSKDEAIEPAKTLVDFWARRSPIFARSGDTYEFIHPSFQDFLAAREIERISDQDFKTLKRFINLFWKVKQDVALFLLGLLSDDQELVSRLVRTVYKTSFWYRWLHPRNSLDDSLRFAAYCLTDGIRLDNETQSSIWSDLQDLANNRQLIEAERRESAELLGILGDSDALVTLAKDKDATELGRVYAIASLVRWGYIEETTSLAYDEEINMRLRAGTILALLQQGRKDVVLSMVRNEQVDFLVRELAITSLYMNGHIDEVAALVLDEQVSSKLREGGITFLLGGHLEGVAALADDDHADSEMRRRAVEVLTVSNKLEDTERIGLKVALSLTGDEQTDLELRRTTVALLAASDHLDEVEGIARNAEMRTEVRMAAVWAVVNFLAKGEVETYEGLDNTEDQQIEALDARIRKMFADLAQEEAMRTEFLDMAKDESQSADLRIGMLSMLIESGRADAVLSLVRDRTAYSNLRLSSAMVLNKSGYSNRLIELLDDQELEIKLRAYIFDDLLEEHRADTNMFLTLIRNENLEDQFRTYILRKMLQIGNVNFVFDLIKDTQADLGVRSAAIRILRESNHINELVTLARNDQLEEKLRIFLMTQLLEAGRCDSVGQLILHSNLSLEARGIGIGFLGESGCVDELQTIVNGRNRTLGMLASETLRGLDAEAE